ncbi:MAG TPA: hypothetical protein VGR07_07550, partial [Thermoanaerobaculia bacterium]|nr:hypothetical protein [Thermoanaerobaculia bacterium]
FEHALGRRIGWSFSGHQIQIAPHAFVEGNAFYSKNDRALLFGYFPRSPAPAAAPAESGGEDETARDQPRFRGMVFTCLSHDVVAHETTHALLDGLREHYTDPSSPDQAAFHEGFADIVALLSIFSLADVVQTIIDRQETKAEPEGTPGSGPQAVSIAVDHLTRDSLRSSLLFALGPEIGKEVTGRNAALRESIHLTPEAVKKDPEKYEESHNRGEILVAAVLNAFLLLWRARIKTLGRLAEEQSSDAAPAPANDAAAAPAPKPAEATLLDRKRVVEDGAAIADQLLTMCIRALDYCPPTDLRFSDFLSALLTADREIRPLDAPLPFRATLRQSFADYGIRPTSGSDGTEPGIWEPPDCELDYSRVHLDPMRHDEDEMFRFLWENRGALGLDRDAYTRVLSVRPAVRVNPEDGFVLRETVVEYYQILNVVASELRHLGIRKPKEPTEMSDDKQVTLYGGGALIFDEFGRLKFHVRNRLLNPTRQTERLKYLWRGGRLEDLQILEREASPDFRFARMHEERFATASIAEGKDDDDQYF